MSWRSTSRGKSRSAAKRRSKRRTPNKLAHADIIVFNKTVLANGLRVVSREMPGTRSVSLGIWVENGSRHESRRQNGISHFSDPLFFKGTEHRSAAPIPEEIDSVGGVLNAFTAKKYTATTPRCWTRI